MTPARDDHQTRVTSPLILVIGTGRCGLRSLVELFNRQQDVHVTVAVPPSLVWTEPVDHGLFASRLRRLREAGQARLVGDAAHFYLPYIEAAIEVEPGIRVICLERPRGEVVASFCRWLDTACPLPTNHWAIEPAGKWHHDPIWSRTFPQYRTDDRADGIGRYWDFYHSRTVELFRRFAENVRIFSTGETLGTEAGRQAVLSFAGIPIERQVRLSEPMPTAARPEEPHPRRTIFETSAKADPGRCVVLVPYTDAISPLCEEALRVLEGRGYSVWRIGGFAAIDQGRAQMATDALVQGYEETMWIDSDMGFNPDAVDMLRSRRLPIVCGIYPRKGQRMLSCRVLPGTKKLNFGERGGLTEILYPGGGFVLVRRQVYMDVQTKLGLPVCNERWGRPLIPFFQPMVHPDDEGSWYLAEDWAFFERARQCGHRTMADTTIRVWHVGAYNYGWEDAGLDARRYRSFDLTLD
jgi:hypothetical protein